MVLAGVAQWIERWPVNQRVIGSIPGQGTCLGCEPGAQQGGEQEATTHCFSPSLSPSLPLCLKNKINKILKDAKTNSCSGLMPGGGKTGNQTGDPLARRLALNPLSHTNQGYIYF